MFTSEIFAEGRIVGQLSEGVFRAVLENGHQATVHLSRELKKNQIKILLQQKVLLSFSTHDLSRACIVQRQ